MPDTGTSATEIRNVYNAGIKALSKVLGSTKASAAAKRDAEKALDELTTSMLAHEIESVQGRTALLSGLIVDLNVVIDRIEDSPPLGKVLGELQGVVTKATSLWTEEKKSLLG